MNYLVKMSEFENHIKSAQLLENLAMDASYLIEVMKHNNQEDYEINQNALRIINFEINCIKFKPSNIIIQSILENIIISADPRQVDKILSDILSDISKYEDIVLNIDAIIQNIKNIFNKK